MPSQQLYSARVLKRELLLLLLVASYLKQIAQKYPGTKALIAELHSEIIALTIDWD